MPGPPPRGVEIKVRTRSQRDAVEGEHDGALVLRVKAKPVEGKANKAVRKLIAERAGVPASSVEIVRGEKSSRKVVAVAGMSAGELRARLLG